MSTCLVSSAAPFARDLAAPEFTAPEAGRSPGGDGDLALLRRAFAPAQPSAASLDLLRTHSLVLRQPAGPLELSSPAQPVPAWWLLRRGRVALGWRNEQGVFVEQRLIGPGEWLDVAGATASPAAWVEDAQCRTAVELMALPLSTLYNACAGDSALMQALGDLLSARVRGLSRRLHDVVTADVPARLARWLLRRLEGQGAAQPARLVLTELKQSIAAQLGTTSETFSRALRRFADAGIVQVQGYELTVLDAQALAEVAWPNTRGGRARRSLATFGRVGAASS